MESQAIAVVPSQQRKVFVLEEEKGKNFSNPAKVVEWLRKQNESRPLGVICVMGGPGQELFARILQMGIPVNRIPIYKLQECANLTPKSLAEDRAAALQLAWKEKSQSFYLMTYLDPTVLMVRELTRQRLNVQDFRKPATNQLHGALRVLEFVLPEEGQQLVVLLRESLKKLFREPELRDKVEAEFSRLEREVQLNDSQQAHLFSIRRFFSNPRFILGAKEDEEELEKRILQLLRRIEIWSWLNPGKDSVLPAIKGFGPSIGGSIISEIGDIRRFPTRESLRAYARFHVSKGGGFPMPVKGEPSPWNRYLNRAVWLWSTDQAARYDHPWRSLLYWKKAKELQDPRHSKPVAREVTDKRGRKRIVYDFTLKHLDSRAERWVGSQMLNYLWDLWQVAERGGNSEDWYRQSSWPAYFVRVEQELNSGLLEYLKQEIPKRQRQEPESEAENEELKEE